MLVYHVRFVGYSIEPCADVIVPGGAARRGRSKIFFLRFPKNISFYPQHVLMTRADQHGTTTA